MLLPGKPPIDQRQYISKEEPFKQEIDKMLQAGILKPVHHTLD